jgi:hypothetical protein
MMSFANEGVSALISFLVIVCPDLRVRARPIVGLHPAASRSMISANGMAKQEDTAMRRDKLPRNRDLIAADSLNA